MFSIGCSLLEMWTDGASVFTLSELYNYREGQTAAVDNLLNSLEDETVKVSVSCRNSVSGANAIRPFRTCLRRCSLSTLKTVPRAKRSW